MGMIYLICCSFLSHRSLDVKTNHGPRCPVPAVCRILWSNVRDLSGNIGDLTVHGFVSVWFTVTLWDFGLRYVSGVVGTGSRIWSPWFPYPWDGYGAFRQPKYECGSCEMLVLGFVAWDSTFMCSIFTSPWPRLFTNINGCRVASGA